MKNVKKKVKRKGVLSQKSSRPASVNKEIKEIEKSIKLLTKKIEEDRRKESNASLKRSVENYRIEQISPEFFSKTSTISCKLKNNHKNFSKKIPNMRNETVAQVKSSHIYKYNYDQERSRITNRTEPIRTLKADSVSRCNVTRVPSESNLFENGTGSRKLKTMYGKFDQIREFIKLMNVMESRKSTRSDGIDHKDTPQKKNGSDLSEEAETQDLYRNIQQIVKNRRIIIRNRVFASRPPMLETVIEEPEKVFASNKSIEYFLYKYIYEFTRFTLTWHIRAGYFFEGPSLILPNLLSPLPNCPL